LAGVDAAAIKYQMVCPVGKQDVTTLVLDRMTGEYVLEDQLLGDGSNGLDGTRQLQQQQQQQRRIHVGSIVDYHHIRRKQQEQSDNSETSEKLLVRKCSCENVVHPNITAYCPLDQNRCGFHDDDNYIVECFTVDRRTSLLQNMWPVIVLWYGALVSVLFLTQQGRNARYFMAAKCCRNTSINERQVQVLMAPNRRDSFWSRYQERRLTGAARTHHQHHALDLEQDQGREPKPIELELKTKRYVHPKESTTARNDKTEDVDEASSDDFQTAATCSICIVELEEGDRVGVLPCEHQFHVDCLKAWLPRRNVCPLCQTPNVAVPRYDYSTSITTDEHSHDTATSNDTPNGPTIMTDDRSDRVVTSSWLLQLGDSTLSASNNVYDRFNGRRTLLRR
jgi:hypothetical protein